MDRVSQCRATRCSTMQHGVTRGPCKGYLVKFLAHTTTLSASQHNCALQKASLVLVCISDHVSFCETFDFRLDVSTGPVVTPRWAHTSNLKSEVWGRGLIRNWTFETSDFGEKWKKTAPTRKFEANLHARKDTRPTRLEIIFDLPFGFPINNIISQADPRVGKNSSQCLWAGMHARAHFCFCLFSRHNASNPSTSGTHMNGAQRSRSRQPCGLVVLQLKKYWNITPQARPKVSSHLSFFFLWLLCHHTAGPPIISGTHTGGVQ